MPDKIPDEFLFLTKSSKGINLDIKQYENTKEIVPKKWSSKNYNRGSEQKQTSHE